MNKLLIFFALASLSFGFTPSDVSKKLPDITITDLQGKPVKIQEYAKESKYTILSFWATWCAPCLKEIPDFSAFDEARTDVVVLGIAFEEIELADLRAFLEKRPAEFTSRTSTDMPGFYPWW